MRMFRIRHVNWNFQNYNVSSLTTTDIDAFIKEEWIVDIQSRAREETIYFIKGVNENTCIINN